MDSDQIAAAVLARTIDIHPERVDLAEVTREVCGENADAETRAAVEHEVAELRKVKLIHPGHYIEPTRAALRYHELLETG